MFLTEKIKDKMIQGLHLRRAIELVWQSTPGWTVLSFCLTVIQGLLPLLAIYLLKLIVDAVTAGVAAPDKSLAFKQCFSLLFSPVWWPS
jgi:ATP-binding cassette subfamily B protein